MADNRTIVFNEKMRYSEKYDHYTFQMKHRRNYWWMLLFLLPLLLFIRCEKDLKVVCLDKDSGERLSGVSVEVKYTAHFLYSDGSFFKNRLILMEEKTDEEGEAFFKKMPCSVYSYLFYCLSKMSVEAADECHEAEGQSYFFHFTSSVTLLMEPHRENLYVKIVDLETGDPLPDATLSYKYMEAGVEKVDSVHADAAGEAVLPDMRYCGLVSELRGSCYGYADTTRCDVPCQDLLEASDRQALRLRPIKERFTFFVKNKETKEPIPNAICQVELTRPSGKKSQPRTLTTSIDGKGIAAYDDAFVLATISITAQKQHFKPGSLEGGPWVVEKFIEQSDDVRTIWLESEPYLVEYVNVDSINGRPIPGVRNEIVVTDPVGKVERFTEISNGNGVFPVTAKENSKIEIISTKQPYYKKKQTLIRKFRDKKVIPMEPVMAQVRLRTVEDVANRPLLPQCALDVKGSISGRLQPSNSGNGEFTVKARLGEQVSIVASKDGYSTNSTTVRNTPMSDLKSGKDIPLKPDPVEYNYSKDIQGVSKECYDLKRSPVVRFSFSWNCCSACTLIVVQDDNGNVIARFGVDSPGGNGDGMRYTPPSGSVVLSSSTQSICVLVQNVNGHVCTYQIKVLGN